MNESPMVGPHTEMSAGEFHWDGRDGIKSLNDVQLENYPKKRIVVESPLTGNRLAFVFDCRISEPDINGFFGHRCYTVYKCCTDIMSRDKTPFRLIFNDWHGGTPG